MKDRFLFTASLPESKLDRRGRVAAGYKKIDREGEKYLNDVASKLKTQNISSVFASDHDAPAAEYVARRMGLPFWVSRKLRGFNFGRFGGHHKEEVSAVLESLFRKWGDNPTVPIVGGDSWTSYERRFLAELIKIVNNPESVNVLLLLSPMDHEVWREFATRHSERHIPIVMHYEVQNKIFKTRMVNESTATTEPVQRRSERAGNNGRPVPDVNADARISEVDSGVVRTAVVS